MCVCRRKINERITILKKIRRKWKEKQNERYKKGARSILAANPESKIVMLFGHDRFQKWHVSFGFSSKKFFFVSSFIWSSNKIEIRSQTTREKMYVKTMMKLRKNLGPKKPGESISIGTKFHIHLMCKCLWSLCEKEN